MVCTGCLHKCSGFGWAVPSKGCYGIGDLQCLVGARISAGLAAFNIDALNDGKCECGRLAGTGSCLTNVSFPSRRGGMHRS